MDTNKIIKFLVSLGMAAVVLFLVWYFSRVVIYILVSAVLAIVGRPLVNRLARIKIGDREVSRSLAASITLVVMWLFFGALLAIFLPPVVEKISQLVSMDWDSLIRVVEDTLVNLRERFERLFAVEYDGIAAAIKEMVAKNIDVDYMSTFSNLVSLLTTSFISFFSISFITFYFMKEDGLFYRLVALLFPERYRGNVYHALDSITALLSRYFGGLMFESLMLLVIISVILILFGMGVGDALVIGLTIGVLNVIPYAGPFIGCLLSVVMGVIAPIDGDIPHTVIIIVSTIIGVKLIDDFMIQPSVYSDRVQAHPLEVFLVILIAGYVAGVWGMLLAIPLYTVLRVFAREFFSEYSVVRRLTSQMTK